MWGVFIFITAFVVGAVPFSYLTAYKLTNTDLRQVDNGTVSGTGLYRVAGFMPLIVGGLLDVGKGALGPYLTANYVSDQSWVLIAFVATVTVVGHNWSLFLCGAGGRGLSPALGAFAIIAWPASLCLLSGLAIGRLLRHTAMMMFFTLLAMPWLLLWVNGYKAAIAAGIIATPMLIKRVTGNKPLPSSNRFHAATHRLVFDNDSWAAASVISR